MIHYRKGFAWQDDPSHEFNWHPFLMTIGLVFLYGNGTKYFYNYHLEDYDLLIVVDDLTMRTEIVCVFYCVNKGYSTRGPCIITFRKPFQCLMTIFPLATMLGLQFISKDMKLVG